MNDKWEGCFWITIVFLVLIFFGSLFAIDAYRDLEMAKLGYVATSQSRPDVHWVRR